MESMMIQLLFRRRCHPVRSTEECIFPKEFIKYPVSFEEPYDTGYWGRSSDFCLYGTGEISHLPGLIESYDETDEYNLGTWEGNPLDMFGSILTGIHVSDVVITGEGTLDGNASYENWWKGEGREKIGGAFRPRMIF